MEENILVAREALGATTARFVSCVPPNLRSRRRRSVTPRSSPPPRSPDDNVIVAVGSFLNRWRFTKSAEDTEVAPGTEPPSTSTTPPRRSRSTQRAHGDVLSVVLPVFSGEERLLVTVSHDGEVGLWREAEEEHQEGDDAKPWLQRVSLLSLPPATAVLEGLSSSDAVGVDGASPLLPLHRSSSSQESFQATSLGASAGLGRGERLKWKMMHAALSPDNTRLAACSWLPRASGGALLVFSLDARGVGDAGEAIKVQHAWRADVLAEKSVSVALANGDAVGSGASPALWSLRFAEFSSTGNLLVSFEGKPQRPTEGQPPKEKHVDVLLCVVNSSSGEVMAARRWPDEPTHHRHELLASQYVSVGDDAGVFILSRGRHVCGFDPASLQLRWKVSAPGSGSLRCFRFVPEMGGALFCPSENGRVQVVWPEDDRNTVELTGIPHGMAYFVDADVVEGDPAHPTLWLSNENAIGRAFIPNLDDAQDGTAALESPDFLSFHAVTCCGVDTLCSASLGDVRDDDVRVVSGDLSGKLMEWRLGSGGSPIHQARVPDSVRCTAAHPYLPLVAVGGLIGGVYMWSPHDDDCPAPSLLQAGENTVTVLRWRPNLPPVQLDDSFIGELSVGSTDGRLACWRVTREAGGEVRKEELWNILAHPPLSGAEADDRFGSLTKWAEIWSCSWSPDGNFIATVSEDQNCRVFAVENDDRGDPALVATLVGHTLAATCVDWQHVASRDDDGRATRCMLMTSSDDKTLRLYATDLATPTASPTLLGVLHTDDCEEWHTITYAALERFGTRVIAATQHGYVGVWSTISMELLYLRKLHTGSIEGLAWRAASGSRVDESRESLLSSSSSTVVTCSSDCTVVVHDLLGGSSSREIAIEPEG
jgi:WD40 repeat protein